MATRVYGIDLGAYSVKVAVATVGFRNAALVHVEEMRVPEGDGPFHLRAATAVGQIVRNANLSEDIPYAAMAGDQVFIHVIEFPFKSLRRSDLAQAVGNELEGLLPVDLEDMVFDFAPLPRSVPDAPVEVLDGELGFDDDTLEPTSPGASSPAIRGPVAEPTEGMRILACATRNTRAAEILGYLGEVGAQPRGLIAAPASYARLSERLSAFSHAGGPKDGGGQVAIVDLGHARTDVCAVVGGKVAYARTITRGGKDLTASIAKAWSLPESEAEEAKHRDGFIASSGRPAKSEAWAKISEVLSVELAPLCRDIRQTLAACQAKTGVVVGELVLLGGASRLQGLCQYLEENIGIKAQLLTSEDEVAILGDQAAYADVRADSAALAAGIAFDGATGRPAFDLRQGGLAYKADLSFLRGKMPQLVASLVAILLFGAACAYAGLHRLRKEESNLADRLATESRLAFGKELDAEDVLEKVGPVGDGEKSPVPTVTAYDILVELNENMPDKNSVAINIEQVNITPTSVEIRDATSAPTEKSDALEGIKLLVTDLKKSPCFPDVSNPESDPGANDTRRFKLSIDIKCGSQVEK